MTRIGYLIPEFPGQTHSFFWRELLELRHMGILADVVSTRPPRSGSVGHDWETEPDAHAYYLMPLKVQAALALAGGLAPALWDRRARNKLRHLVSEMHVAARSEPRGGLARNLVMQAGLICAGADLARLAEARGIAHVHVHSCANAAQVALYAKVISGLTYSLSLHGSLGDYGPNQPSKWRNASVALIITKVLLESIKVELLGSLPAQVAIAPMGVQTDLFKRSSPYQAFQAGGELRLVSCGRLNESKGHDQLIRAVAELRKRGFSPKLHILGEDESGGGGYRRVLEQLIMDLDIGDSVELLGSLPETEVVAQLQQAHVFVLASHSEPLGVAIMEAMSMQLPVVVTGTGGVPELVEDGVSGVLVEPGNPAGIVEAVTRMAQSPALATALGRAARERVVDSFQSSRSAKVLAALVEFPCRQDGNDHGQR